MRHTNQNFKRRAHDLVDRLPHDADWSDLADFAMARLDMEENGLRGDSGYVAEEIFEEYERIHAEVGRDLAQKGWDGS